MANPILQYLNSTTLLLIAILFFSYYALKRSKSRSKPKTAPEVGGAWPIIGHLRLLAGTELLHKTLSTLADTHGPIFTIRIGSYPNLVVSSWELAKELFTTNDVVVSTRPKLTAFKLLGHDYANFAFSPYGEYWRSMRKMVALELLSSRRLELLKPIRGSEVEGSIRELHKLWSENKNDSHQLFVEMKQWFRDLNFNVILRMVAGKRYFGSGSGSGSGSDDKAKAQRHQMVIREFFQLAGQLVLRDAIPYLGWLDLGGYEKAMKKTAEELDSIISDWLDEHRRRLKLDSGIEESGNCKEQDFMDVLLFSLDGVDLAGYEADTVRKATALTLILGGTDTTTVTMTWALSLLLNNPDSMRKVQEELDNHVGRERLLNESDLHKLVYLQAIVKEALRLYGPAPISAPREFSADCTIGGHHVPAGTRLIVNTYKIQRDPRVWPDPTEFKPERFLTTHKDVDVKGQHFEIIPFGAGRRACPGIYFAIQMVQLALASFLQAFEMATPWGAAVDMTETAGLTNCKGTPLDVLIKPRLPAYLYENN